MANDDYIYLTRVCGEDSSKNYELCLERHSVPKNFTLGIAGGDLELSGQDNPNVRVEEIPMTYFFGADTLEDAIDSVRVLGSELSAVGAIKKKYQQSISEVSIEDSFLATKSTLLIIKIPASQFERYIQSQDIVSYSGSYGNDTGEHQILQEYKVSSNLLIDLLCHPKDNVMRYGLINDVLQSIDEPTIAGLRTNYVPSITVGLESIKKNSTTLQSADSTPTLIAKKLPNGKIIFEMITINSELPDTVKQILDWANNNEFPMSEMLEMVLGSIKMSGYKFVDKIDRELIGLKTKKKPTFDDSYNENNYQTRDDDDTDDDTPLY